MLGLNETDTWLAACLPHLQMALNRLDETAIDALLDRRDAAPFDSCWVDADAALEAHKRALPTAMLNELTRFSDDRRQQVYQIVIHASGSPDLAAYVSDDFALMLEANALCWSHDFIDSLSAAYLAGKIPDSGALI